MRELRAPGSEFGKACAAAKKSPAGQAGRAQIFLVGKVFSGRNVGRGRVSFICARCDVEIALFEWRMVPVGMSSTGKGPACRNKSPRQVASYRSVSSHMSAYWKCDSIAVTAHLMPASRTHPSTTTPAIPMDAHVANLERESSSAATAGWIEATVAAWRSSFSAN